MFRHRFGILFASFGLIATASQAFAAGPEYDLPEVVSTAGSQQPASKPGKSGSNNGGPNGPIGSPKGTAGAAATAASSDQGAAGASNAPEPAEEGISSGRVQSDRIVEQITTVDQVTAAQIERSGASTLDEAIRLVPGVAIVNGGDGVPRLNIRGFRTRNITLLIDGVPQNATYDGQFDPRAIPVENIARIKITRGGSSVLYGPGGNAAVIDIITKSAKPGLHATTEASFGAGKDREGRVTASYGSDTVRSLASASIYDQDAYRLSNDFSFTKLQPNDARVNSDREDRSYYANTQWTPSDTFNWGFSVSHRSGEYGKPPTTFNSFNNAGVCQNQATNGPCDPFSTGLRFERVDDYDNLSLQTSGLIKLGHGLTLRPMAYYNKLDELTNRFDNASYNTQLLNGASREDATTSIFGGGGQLAYRIDESNLVTLALDAHREDWNSEGFSRKSIQVTTPASSQTKCDAACKAQLQNVCDRRGGTLAGSGSGGGGGNGGGGGTGGGGGNGGGSGITVSNGVAQGSCSNARNDIWTYKGLNVYSTALEYETHITSRLSAVVGGGLAEQQREDTSDSDYTYLAGLRFAVTDDTALRGSVARKIRFPTLRNLYGTDEGDSSLKTEVTQNYEIAIEHQMRNINAYWSVTAFRIDAKNFISKDRFTQLFENKDLLRFQGVETTATFRPTDILGIQLGYTYLHSENLAPVPGGTNAVQFEPEHTVTVSANYRVRPDLVLNADYQFIAGSVALSRDELSTLELDAYHLVNLGLTQDLAGGSAQIFGRIENLLDENYQTAYGFPEAGRTYYLGFRSKL